MKSGQVFQEFIVNQELKVVLRMPRWEDLDDLLEPVNSLLDEGRRYAEMREFREMRRLIGCWGILAWLEKDKTFFLVAEVGGRVIASSDIDKQRGYEKHVGVVGIVVIRGFRDLGIGTAMMRVLLDQARKMGLKVLTLSAFASNQRAIHVYEKVGFAQSGLIPKKHFMKGKYMDEVIMTRVLE